MSTQWNDHTFRKKRFVVYKFKKEKKIWNMSFLLMYFLTPSFENIFFLSMKCNKVRMHISLYAVLLFYALLHFQPWHEEKELIERYVIFLKTDVCIKINILTKNIIKWILLCRLNIFNVKLVNLCSKNGVWLETDRSVFVLELLVYYYYFYYCITFNFILWCIYSS